MVLASSELNACLLLEQAGIFLILAHGCAVAHAGTCVDTMPDFSTSKWPGILEELHNLGALKNSIELPIVQ
jgi:hypothetical protein